MLHLQQQYRLLPILWRYIEVDIDFLCSQISSSCGSDRPMYTPQDIFSYILQELNRVESILITHAESPSTWSTNLWKLFDFCIYENIGESIVQSLFSHSSNWGFYLKTFGIGSIAVAVLNNCGTDIIVNHELMHLKAIDDQYYKERFLGDDDLLRSKRTN